MKSIPVGLQLVAIADAPTEIDEICGHFDSLL
jgi:hypothetical protein